jgi:hypothetical protein
MSDYKYDMSDLVSAAAAQKPLDFEAAFNDLIVDRIATAINDKKISVAQQMYGYTTDNEETEEPEEELEDNQDGETA